MSEGSGDWDVVVRPHLTPIYAWIVAAVIIVAHITVALLLKVRTSGVIFQTADQVAFAGFGVILGGCVLLLVRPRLRVGPAGLSVRNLFGDRLVPWSQTGGVSFPAAKRWAQIDLPNDEYIPVMAIQAVDGERAVAAMDAVRALVARYRIPGEDSQSSEGAPNSPR